MMRPLSLLMHLVPVGISQEACAGTPIEGWMPWEVQQEIDQSKAQKADADRSA